MKVPSAVWGYVAAGAVVIVIYQMVKSDAKKGAQAAGNFLTGDGDVTKNATNAQGESVASAYEGKGIVGSLGASANAIFGGVLATAGQDLSAWFFEKTH